MKRCGWMQQALAHSLWAHKALAVSALRLYSAERRGTAANTPHASTMSTWLSLLTRRVCILFLLLYSSSHSIVTLS